MRFPLATFAACALLPVLSVQAHFMQPEDVPVKRLVEITSKAVREQPGNAAAHYALARVHYLAFASSAERLQAYLPNDHRDLATVGPFEKNSTAGDHQRNTEARRRALLETKSKGEPSYNSAEHERFYQRVEEVQKELTASGWRPDRISESAAAEHLSRAAEEFPAALRLDPKNALYQLGYASLHEQAGVWARLHPRADLPGELHALTPAVVRAGYLDAWRTELSADLKDKNRGALSAMDMVSYEAGTAFVRLAEAAGDDLSEDEKQSLKKVRASLVTLAELSGRAITPIIFGARAVSCLAELLAPETNVSFPLRGWGPVGKWPWVQPDTALLVWDPRGDGRVRSGAQLFGSYTWELFWSNGYEPLAVLDLDGDGSLTGAELAGLGAWFDRDGNGVCDLGEVVPLGTLGVTALAVCATGFDGDAPTNPRGIAFADGRILPTWDWIVNELPANPARGMPLATAH